MITELPTPGFSTHTNTYAHTHLKHSIELQKSIDQPSQTP